MHHNIFPKYSITSVIMAAITTAFITFHLLTKDYPYFSEDEGSYIAFGLQDAPRLDVGAFWTMYIHALQHIDVANYRCLPVLWLIVSAICIIGVFSFLKVPKVGLIGAAIFVVCPFTFHSYHSIRPEAFHSALASVCLLACVAAFRFSFLDTAPRDSAARTGFNPFIRLALCPALFVFAIAQACLLPYIHIYAIVYIPAITLLIVGSVAIARLNRTKKAVLISLTLISTGATLIHFSTKSLPLESAQVGGIPIAKRVSTTLNRIIFAPGSTAIYDTAGQLNSEWPRFLIRLCSEGRHLKSGTSFLLIAGFIGALISIVEGCCCKRNVFIPLAISVIACLGTFAAIIYRTNYHNMMYTTAVLPWAAFGFAMGAGSLLHVSRERRMSFLKRSVVFLVPCVIFIFILLTGLAQLVSFNWPLRRSQFVQNLASLQAALRELDVSSVPFASAPYHAFILPHDADFSAGERPVDFADISKSPIVTLTEARIEEINKFGSAIIATDRMLFFLGTFGPSKNDRTALFLRENFRVAARIQNAFFKNDKFPYLPVTRDGFTFRMGSPFLHQGGEEGITILVPTRKITRSLLEEYINGK